MFIFRNIDSVHSIYGSHIISMDVTNPLSMHVGSPLHLRYPSNFHELCPSNFHELCPSNFHELCLQISIYGSHPISMDVTHPISMDGAHVYFVYSRTPWTLPMATFFQPFRLTSQSYSSACRATRTKIGATSL